MEGKCSPRAVQYFVEDWKFKDYLDFYADLTQSTHGKGLSSLFLEANNFHKILMTTIFCVDLVHNGAGKPGIFQPCGDRSLHSY